MKYLFNFKLACIMWIFPFIPLCNVYFVQKPFRWDLIGAAKLPDNNSECDDYPEARFKDHKDQELYDYLNLQIRNLTNLRNRYDAKIARLRDRADYYQFQRGEYPLDSQELLQRIETYQKMVDRIDIEIIKLKEQRTKLLKKRIS